MKILARITYVNLNEEEEEEEEGEELNKRKRKPRILNKKKRLSLTFL